MQISQLIKINIHADKPEPKSAAPAMPGPGMGGMDY
jgi:hypothetical protein